MNLWNNASPEALQNTYKILHYKNLVLPYRTRNYQYYLYDGKCFEWSVVGLKRLLEAKQCSNWPSQFQIATKRRILRDCSMLDLSDWE
jgi:hypothetical protein